MPVNFYDMQKYAATGITSPDMTDFDKMRALFPQSYPSQTITGIPPLSFKANGQPLSAWLISGNSRQNGTPTPDNPIYPEFVGERTANLFDGKTNIYPNSRGVMVAGTTCISSVFDISNATHISLSTDLNLLNSSIFRIGLSNTPIVAGSTVTRVSCGNETIDVSEYTYACIACAYNSAPGSDPEKILQVTMVNAGSTPLPYEPYGWAEKITCGGVTTPIYLGEVPTVRRIKKYVFDGTQNVYSCVRTTDSQNYCCAFKFSDIGMTDIKDYDVAMASIDYPIFLSNRFVNKDSSKRAYYQDISTGEMGANNLGGGGNRYIIFCVSGLTTAEEYTNWFTNNPTTLYYILATPETVTANEPLAKIGDYVDTVASTNTGAPSIPTVKGLNTLSVDTTVQPSSVTITT